MQKDPPLVSIIIPVYNGANYLGEAIDSALTQSYLNVEVLVINDGSKDNGETARVARKYGRKIRYYEKANGGVATALNLGIKKMKGEWFSWLSHDDIYFPNKIESQINYLKKNPQAKVIYSDFELVDAHLNHLHYSSVESKSTSNMRVRLLNTYPLNGCTMLIHQSCFKNTGKFSEALRTTQDYDLWFRLAKDYLFYYVPIIAIKSRQHSEQGSHTNIHKQEVDLLYSNFVYSLSKKEIKEVLGSKASSMLLSLAREYKQRGYVIAPKTVLARSLELVDSYDPEYLLTKAYCLLPDQLFATISNWDYRLRRKLFEYIGIIKRFFNHELTK